MTNMFCEQCDVTVHHPGLIEQLRQEHFDAVINENFDFCGVGEFLAHI